MAENTESSVGVVAIVAIVILILVALLFVFRSRLFPASEVPQSQSGVNVNLPLGGGNTGQNSGTSPKSGY